jgi:hypothetical protein
MLAMCRSSDTTTLTTSVAANSLRTFLDEYQRHGQPTFVRWHGKASGPERLLSSVTCTHLVMPLFSAGHALFAVIATSTDPSYSFNGGDTELYAAWPACSSLW